MRRSLIIPLSLFVTHAMAADMITPGSGPITDSAGNQWLISTSGSIQENGGWVAGGGGTSALTIVGNTVFGQDARTKQWFTLSGGQYWMPSVAPTASQTPVAAPGVPTTTTASSALSLPTAAVAGICSGVSSTGGFGVFPMVAGGVGQIFDANQRLFQPHGIGVLEGNEPSAATLLSDFPNINFVRLAIYDYASPATLAPLVSDYTSHGIVVDIENHSNGSGNAGGGQGAIFTGGQLSTESAWYASIAAAFTGNPNVWFGTNNEPPDQAGLSAWQLATYNAIRGTGNNAPILLEIDGWADTSSFGSGVAYVASDYAQMSNVIWDMHFYGWLTRMSTDQSENNAFIAAAVNQAQTTTSAGGVKIPVIIGEYGDSTTGLTIDPNAVQVVNAVHTQAMSGTIAGTAAWAYGGGNPGDGLLSGGGLSGYGRQVATYIQQAATKFSGGGSPSCQVATNLTSPTQVALTPTPATDPPLPPAPDSIQATAAAGNAAAQQAMDATDADIAKSEATMAATPPATEQTTANIQAGDALLQKVLSDLAGSH